MGYPTHPARMAGGIARPLWRSLGMLCIPFVGTAAIYLAIYSTEFGRRVMEADMWDSTGEVQYMVFMPLLLFPAYVVFLVMMWRWIRD